jgi:hypothetical protein
MPIVHVYSPSEIEIWGESNGTVSIKNPWGGAKPVWIQCTLGYVSGGGEAELGIVEVDDFDDKGNFRKRSFGNDTYGSHPQRLFVGQLLEVTVIARTYDAIFKGIVTLFMFG